MNILFSCSIVLLLFVTINGIKIEKDFYSLSCNDPLITLYIYSSRTNPRWKLNRTDVLSMISRTDQISQKSALQVSSIQSRTRVMGYQGFSISCPTEKEFFIDDWISFEKELLESGRVYLSSSIVDHVREHLGESRSFQYWRTLSNINCDAVPIRGPDTVPFYNPQTDNGGCFLTRQSTNNCYAYATDIVTNTFPQPGRSRSNGKTPSPITCDSVMHAAIHDGLVYVGKTFPQGQPKIGHYVALFLWPSKDYHWIRKDANGYWSHKPGAGSVTNRDNIGSFISNPLKSNFTPWTSFCAYYIAQPSKLYIK